jgi:hypothetical protein
MANKDVRDWIDGIKAAGELKIITGAEPRKRSAESSTSICAGSTPQRTAS